VRIGLSGLATIELDEVPKDVEARLHVDISTPNTSLCQAPLKMHTLTIIIISFKHVMIIIIINVLRSMVGLVEMKNISTRR